MTSAKKIKCNTIPHRKGFIEVTPNIHPGCINLEAWDVRAEIDIASLDISDEAFPDDGVTGNTEIELSVHEAEEFVHLLQQAISKVKAEGQLS